MEQRIVDGFVALDQFHMMVGRISSQYALLELSIDRSIWALAGIDPVSGACITSQLGSTSSRIRALIELLAIRNGSEDFKKRIEKLNSKTFSVTDIRNRSVHDIWTINDSNHVETITVATSKGKGNPIRAQKISMDEMNSNLKKVSRLASEFSKFTSDIEEWLLTLQHTQRGENHELSVSPPVPFEK